LHHHTNQYADSCCTAIYKKHEPS